jgi:hypothetical protein
LRGRAGRRRRARKEVGSFSEGKTRRRKRSLDFMFILFLFRTRYMEKPYTVC